MNQLEVRLYKKGKGKTNTIRMPLSVLRLNPKLLPAHVNEALESQGISVEEIAVLDNVEGVILDIRGHQSRIVLSIAPITKAKSAKSGAKSKPEPQSKAKTKAKPKPKSRLAPVAARKKKALTPFKQRLTTEFIAREIGWRSGHDLIYAACAHLLIVQESSNWTKEEIDAEIKLANRYYKPLYSSNLAEYLQFLVTSDKLRTVGNNQYALTTNSVRYLEDRLSEDRLRTKL